MKHRATSLSPPDRFLLDQWADQVAVAFGYGPAYLVGSVMHGGEWRDVDVRLMLPPERFFELTGGDEIREATLNVAYSVWGQRATGLPIDFQFQVFDPNSFQGEPRMPIGSPAMHREVYRND